MQNITFKSTLLCSVANIVKWLMSFYYPQVTVTRWYCSNRFISLLVGCSCTKLLAYVSHMATVHVMWEGKVVQLLPHCGTLLSPHQQTPPSPPQMSSLYWVGWRRGGRNWGRNLVWFCLRGMKSDVFITPAPNRWKRCSTSTSDTTMPPLGRVLPQHCSRWDWMTWQMWSLPNMSEVGNCRFIIDTLNLHQSLILCLSCCPSCTKLVVPHYIYYC